MTKEETKYVSTTDTLLHIKQVNNNLCLVALKLLHRAVRHDASKLLSPEKVAFDKATPILASTTYGSPEYNEGLKVLGEALEHHYEVNNLHPEHWPHGIDDMSLIDIIEMLADWQAASLRLDDGNILKSLEINIERFGIEPQLAKILRNTSTEMNWEPLRV